MILGEQVYAQALLLAGQLDERQSQLLQVLCTAAASSLESRLRDGITPEDCKADFIAAASLYALAAMSSYRQGKESGEFKIGDVTVRRSDQDTASKCLYNQAELIITPYLKDQFLFKGV